MHASDDVCPPACLRPPSTLLPPRSRRRRAPAAAARATAARAAATAGAAAAAAVRRRRRRCRPRRRRSVRVRHRERVLPPHVPQQVAQRLERLEGLRRHAKPLAVHRVQVLVHAVDPEVGVGGAVGAQVCQIHVLPQLAQALHHHLVQRHRELAQVEQRVAQLVRKHGAHLRHGQPVHDGDRPHRGLARDQALAALLGRYRSHLRASRRARARGLAVRVLPAVRRLGRGLHRVLGRQRRPPAAADDAVGYGPRVLAVALLTLPLSPTAAATITITNIIVTTITTTTTFTATTLLPVRTLVAVRVVVLVRR
mmetsp:Transcript_8390/g.29819  ORF Transcript_8390/g.29819 Transcript_8390/m.29819 type:complete len:310 (-) Transcript_8390:1143-2072(-)